MPFLGKRLNSTCGIMIQAFPGYRTTISLAGGDEFPFSFPVVFAYVFVCYVFRFTFSFTVCLHIYIFLFLLYSLLLSPVSVRDIMCSRFPFSCVCVLYMFCAWPGDHPVLIHTHTRSLSLSLPVLLCNIKRLLSAWFVISLVPTCVYRRHQSNVLYRCELLGKLITNTWRRQLRPPTAFATRYSLHWMYIIAIVGDVSSSPLLAFSASIIAISWSMGVMHQRSLL